MSAQNKPVDNLTEQTPIRETQLTGVKLVSRGKVRDVYEVSGDRLLVIATDRLSAFDVVMAEGIPDKGRVLSQLSVFWFNHFRGVIPHHFLTARMSSSSRRRIAIPRSGKCWIRSTTTASTSRDT